LLLADLHMGKSGHFRKHGIPVPGRLNQTNLDILGRLIDRLEPEKLIILGDLFHSRENREWRQFERWRKHHAGLDLFLVVGNHDILPDSIYHSSRIHLFHRMRLDPFVFLHDADTASVSQNGNSRPDTNYLLTGHVHPAIQLRGKGRQSMKLPCFYFGEQIGILPAFGQFTGTHVIEPLTGDRIFAVAERRIVRIDTNP